MNEPPPSPLKLDARTVLEAISGTLAFVLAGIAVLDLAHPYSVLAPLGVAAVIVFIGRLLGKNATDSMAQLQAGISSLLASNSVLKADATPTVIRQADEAAKAVGPAPAKERASE